MQVQAQHVGCGEPRRLEHDLLGQPGLAHVVQQRGEAQLLPLLDRQLELLADEHGVVHHVAGLRPRHVLGRVHGRRERSDRRGVVVADAREQRRALERRTGVARETLEEAAVVRAVDDAFVGSEEEVADQQVSGLDLDFEARPVLAEPRAVVEVAAGGDRDELGEGLLGEVAAEYLADDRLELVLVDRAANDDVRAIAAPARERHAGDVEHERPLEHAGDEAHHVLEVADSRERRGDLVELLALGDRIAHGDHLATALEHRGEQRAETVEQPGGGLLDAGDPRGEPELENADDTLADGQRHRERPARARVAVTRYEHEPAGRSSAARRRCSRAGHAKADGAAPVAGRGDDLERAGVRHEQRAGLGADDAERVGHEPGRARARRSRRRRRRCGRWPRAA